MTHSGKLTPNLDQESTKILNLTVLQRIDPNIEEILMTVAHVTFYEFNIQLNEWSRKDVEGSLFVVKRNTQPRFQFIVMNRRNTDNLVETLLGDFEYEVQIPYVLYRNSAQEVTGIWFYDSRECVDVANLFGRILNAYSKVPPKPKVSLTKSDMEDLESGPTMPVVEAKLEPSSSTVSTVRDVPADSSFVNFSGDRNTENASRAAIQEQFHPSPATIPLLSRSPSIKPSPLPAQQIPSAPFPTSSAQLLPHLEIPRTSSNNVTNLVKPSAFFVPSSSSYAPFQPSMPSPVTTTTSHPPVTHRQLHGAPFLQPFPPPTSRPYLAPPPIPSSDSGLVLNRDKVRDALLRLVQNNQFIDMFYQELLNVTTN